MNIIPSARLQALIDENKPSDIFVLDQVILDCLLKNIQETHPSAILVNDKEPFILLKSPDGDINRYQHHVFLHSVTYQTEVHQDTATYIPHLITYARTDGHTEPDSLRDLVRVIEKAGRKAIPVKNLFLPKLVTTEIHYDLASDY